MALSQLCTFPVEEKVRAWRGVEGHNGNIPFRERSAKVRLGVAKPNTALCLHGLTLESSLCLYSPSSLFCLSLPQRNPLNPQSDHTSPLLTILTGRVNARALTTSQGTGVPYLPCLSHSTLFPSVTGDTLPSYPVVFNLATTFSL